ncbi:hypothetical protein ElyMa_006497300 [Elysia marginata]|uniref:Uncharacterized protein n=1 Tax=Elysia marginata TaxID=1093978 RepID=A0AAV4I3T5_9GAST|nr:hypothetical protein ElyMa_006497300 [Elysia marginata]
MASRQPTHCHILRHGSRAIATYGVTAADPLPHTASRQPGHCHIRRHGSRAIATYGVTAPVKTLAQRSGGTGLIPGRVKPRTSKLVLVAADPPGV